MVLVVRELLCVSRPSSALLEEEIGVVLTVTSGKGRGEEGKGKVLEHSLVVNAKRHRQKHIYAETSRWQR